MDKQEGFKIREGRFMVASAASTSGVREAAGPGNTSGTREAAGPEHISGDAACACSLPDGRLAFILSDGMGKGMKAAAESQAVIVGLRKHLKNGIPPSKAIKLVNKSLIDYGGKQAEIGTEKESFATVDLTIIDKGTGLARFYKMGAVSSFLLRDKQVKKIEHAALPVGVVQRIKASQIKIKLKQNDTLVIVSDGITEADKRDLETKWLEEYLTNTPKDMGPKVMASEIANLAQLKYSNREKDDITVFVIQIK